jgi:putative hydrolase
MESDKSFFGGTQGPFGASGTGEAVNWDVARQVATWFANEQAQKYSLQPSKQRPRSLPDLSQFFRIAELRLSESTPKIPGVPTAAEPAVMTRPEWASRSVDEFKLVLLKVGRQLTASARYEEPATDTPIAAMVAPLLPVLLGGQLGLLLGRIACWVTSGFDVLLPRSGPPRPVVIGPALQEIAESFDVDISDVALWVSLHEYAHLRQFQVPWLRRFLIDKVEAAISRIAISPESVAEKLASVDPTDPASVEALAEDPSGLLMALLVPPPPEVTVSLRVLVSLMEAAADHAAAVAAVSMGSDLDRTREVLRRHRIERSASDFALLRLCGLEVSGREHAAALAFCQFVTSESGFELLNRVWESPDSLPRPDELTEPIRWIERIRASD